MSIKIMKIYRESFKDVWRNMLPWIRVAYAPFLIWALGVAFMGLVYWSLGHSLELHQAMLGQTKSIEEFGEHRGLAGLAHFVYFITYFIAIINLYINGYRYGVLHQGGNDWWNLHLNRRFVKMILYMILIGVLAIAYVLISAGIVLAFHYSFESIPINVAIAVLLFLFGIYLAVRIGLTFVLIAIDKTQPLANSWKLLKGNILRLIGLMFLVGITIAVISIVGIAVLALLGLILTAISPILAAIIAILIFLFGVFIWFFNWAVISKALSLVYLSLTEGHGVE